ncbi:hypothetical protein VM1G_11894 [Cytospora mali]|uniref:Uncharacterized protein n=1 Tax=Cytospora mali TaxID=578113 RepID=A0A194WBR7_CYTMA|nr:hypothetical protein VM1G_11894 [Valsa mali]
MNQAPQNCPAQGDTGNEEMETRRSKCLTEVLSHGIVKIMRHSVAIERAFFCRSDLARLWCEKPRSESRPLDTVFFHLSEGQREAILEKLLLFISFLVFEDVSPYWFSTCGPKLFGQHWQRSTQLEFEDNDGPISEEHLRELGLTPTQAAHWQEQYMFRPARIRFDPDVWRQEIDPCEPLPFEKVHQDNPTGSMVHVEDGDSTGYYSEFGTVHVQVSADILTQQKLYKIPEECVVDVRRGSEEWIPVS